MAALDPAKRSDAALQLGDATYSNCEAAPLIQRERSAGVLQLGNATAATARRPA